MKQIILNDREISFLLYEFLDSERLLTRPRYTEHSRETFNGTLETANKIAEKYFANHNTLADSQEPAFDGEEISIIPQTKTAWDNFSEAGFLAAHYDFELGGMQLPEVILRAAMAYFNAANIATTAYTFLTIAAANLIHVFGNTEQKKLFIPPMQDGRFAGTMALTEPGQGSALADIKTIAKPVSDGSFRIFGQKMFISGGDQNLTDNIIHLVLAKIEGAPEGVKGISLFICPKFLLNSDGTVGAKNDVALAGLLHKMGYRNTTSTALNFGEKNGAVGFLVGEPHKGLRYMFQMMNEARICVGLGAAALGYQGYLASLRYARERPQGRLPSNNNPSSRQVKIIEHADVRRMLLAQKSYSEGALAMCLYASSLFEDSKTATSEEERTRASQLLDLLTPVVKSWPSKYCLTANDLAIQIFGGSGYIREYPVEQYYRDNRLNAIHEGTEGIHGLDILGRKVVQNNGAAFRQFITEINTTLATVKNMDHCADLGVVVTSARNTLTKVTSHLGEKLNEDADLTLANATVYLDMFGRVFASWIWLQQAVLAERALQNNDIAEIEKHFYRGKLQAARYYIFWELPQIEPQASLLLRLDDIPYSMQDAWF